MGLQYLNSKSIKINNLNTLSKELIEMIEFFLQNVSAHTTLPMNDLNELKRDDGGGDERQH